jgi:hypothetical protein
MPAAIGVPVGGCSRRTNKPAASPRQIEIYDHGPTKLYGPDLIEDADGGLAQSRLDASEDWSRWEISEGEFQNAWSNES